MNVLEKILEEIEKEQNSYEADHAWNYSKGMEYAKEIIRSHIDEAKDTNIHSNDDDYIMFTLNKDGVVEMYLDTYDIIIHCESSEEQKRVRGILERCNGWIPVEERLPEVLEGLADEYCPEFNVTIKGAEKATTLKYSWDGTWFDDNGNVYNVIAWQPLPEPYKPKKNIPVAGMDHIMSRFTKVE